MSTALPDLTEALLDHARRAGADAADALAIDGTSLTVQVSGGRLEQAERAESVEIGLRVMVGTRQACVAASDITQRTLAEMAERAVAMARVAPEDATIGLAEPGQLSDALDAAALDMIDPGEEPDPALLEGDAREAEAAALALDGIAQVSDATAAFGRRSLHLAATNGFAGGYARTDHAISCVAITGAGTGMERDYYGDVRCHRADLDAPGHVGRLAAERTLARSGARKPPTGTFPVLFDERIAASLIGHLLQAANGTAVARGSSWLSDALGQQVLPGHLSLIEEPRRPRASGSRPFDAEGLATRDRAIVADGVLAGWTLDLATGRKLGMASTASAARGPSGPPSPQVSNIRLTQGGASRDDLIAEIGTGLLVTAMMGASISPTTGDYSRGASGFWVENGRIAYPVNECTIAGNLREMLARIVPANDARPHLSRVVPSLLVPGMTVAGA